MRSLLKNLPWLTLLLAVVGCGDEPVSEDGPESEDVPPSVSVVEEESDPAKLAAADLLRKLRDVNPDYNNNAQAQNGPDGTVAELTLYQSGVTDISPLEGTQLTVLDLGGVPITDISTLKGMPLQKLILEECQVEDLSPLAGMPLRVLQLQHCPVSDLSPLAGMQLTELNLFGTKVDSIEVLEGMPLQSLWLRETAVTDLTPISANPTLVSLDIEKTRVKSLDGVATIPGLQRLNLVGTLVNDLSPLKGLRLQRVLFTPRTIQKGIDVVRGMESVQEIGPDFNARMQPDQFWPLYDKGEFNLLP